jgi:hypothetical protein
MAPAKAMKDIKATKNKTTVKDMKAKAARMAKATAKAKTARELDSEEHLSDDHFADDDFVDASDSQPEPKAEKDEKKCFSEEHLKEMHVRYREYEFDTEVERLLAKHGK